MALIPSTRKSFLRNDQNKSGLFSFLSKEIVRTQVPQQIIVSTCADSVVSSSTEVDLNKMSRCTHEEADIRVFLHAADCLKQGHMKVIIRTADTNVVVLAISVGERNKDGRVVCCIWDWKIFQIHCNPRNCFKSCCRQIKSFACLSRCNWL